MGKSPEQKERTELSFMNDFSFSFDVIKNFSRFFLSFSSGYAGRKNEWILDFESFSSSSNGRF